MIRPRSQGQPWSVTEVPRDVVQCGATFYRIPGTWYDSISWYGMVFYGMVLHGLEARVSQASKLGSASSNPPKQLGCHAMWRYISTVYSHLPISLCIICVTDFMWCLFVFCCCCYFFCCCCCCVFCSLLIHDVWGRFSVQKVPAGGVRSVPQDDVQEPAGCSGKNLLEHSGVVPALCQRP